jgi:hypothetical protein
MHHLSRKTWFWHSNSEGSHPPSDSSLLDVIVGMSINLVIWAREAVGCGRFSFCVHGKGVYAVMTIKSYIANTV